MGRGGTKPDNSGQSDRVESRLTWCYMSGVATIYPCYELLIRRSQVRILPGALKACVALIEPVMRLSLSPLRQMRDAAALHPYERWWHACRASSPVLCGDPPSRR